MEITVCSIGRNARELVCYMHGNRDRKRPALVICPGGGYSHLSPREDEPVALQFLAAGYNVFCLHYSVAEALSSSRPEEELAEAVKLIRSRAGEFGIDADKIAVMGFSAGGHLAASLACHWRLYGEEARVQAAVLCYPVITMGEHTHMGTKERITQGADDIAYYSLETQVSGDVPPCYIWHTASDQAVPVENSLLFASALSACGTEYELHIYPTGVHGLALAREETDIIEEDAQGWVGEAVHFLDAHLGFTL